MAGPNGEACGGCRFWDRDDDEGGAVGWCRRHAPRPHAGTHLRPWPDTVAGDWCGEFLPLAPPPPDPAVLALRVRDLRWTTRALRTLTLRLGADTLGDVARLRPEQLLATQGCGPTTLREVRTRLAGYGLALSGEAPPGSVAPWGEPGTPAPPLEPAPAPVA